MLIGIGIKHNKVWWQTSVCTIDRDKKLQNRYNIRLLVLKAASETTIDTKKRYLAHVMLF
jgi:hypothetical protein